MNIERKLRAREAVTRAKEEELRLNLNISLKKMYYPLFNLMP